MNTFLRENPETEKLVKQYLDNRSCDEILDDIETMVRLDRQTVINDGVRTAMRGFSGVADLVNSGMNYLANSINGSRPSQYGTSTEVPSTSGLYRSAKNTIQGTAYVATVLLLVLAVHGGRDVYRRVRSSDISNRIRQIFDKKPTSKP